MHRQNSQFRISSIYFSVTVTCCPGLDTQSCPTDTQSNTSAKIIFTHHCFDPETTLFASIYRLPLSIDSIISFVFSISRLFITYLHHTISHSISKGRILPQISPCCQAASFSLVSKPNKHLCTFSQAAPQTLGELPINNHKATWLSSLKLSLAMKSTKHLTTIRLSGDYVHQYRCIAFFVLCLHKASYSGVWVHNQEIQVLQ